MGDEGAIRRVIARYCHTLDDGAFDEFAELWADDAEFVLRGTVTAGRDAIRDAIAAWQPPERRGRHLTINTALDVEGDTARAVSDFQFYGRGAEGRPELLFLGRYLDAFVRTAEGWCFRRREIQFF